MSRRGWTSAALLALLTLGIALTLALAVSSGVAAAKPPAKDPARAITSQLICPCSCGEIVSGCTCETGKAMQGYVEDELKAGKGKEQIEAALVLKYGEVILGAPKAEGFNLVVWILPFVATLAGFAIAALVLVRWVARRAAVPASGAAPGMGSAGEDPGSGGRTAEQDLAALRARAEAELTRLRE